MSDLEVDRIGSDEVGDYWVSTVRLAFPPEVNEQMIRAIGGRFETMIFGEGGLHHGYQRRYWTREQAEQGHHAVVAALRRGDADIDSSDERE